MSSALISQSLRHFCPLVIWWVHLDFFWEWQVFRRHIWQQKSDRKTKMQVHTKKKIMRIKNWLKHIHFNIKKYILFFILIFTCIQLVRCSPFSDRPKYKSYYSKQSDILIQMEVGEVNSNDSQQVCIALKWLKLREIIVENLSYNICWGQTTQ